MFIKALKSKIHRARVTETKLDYPGSIAIDQELLEAGAIAAYEAVLLANVSNGSRAETYVVPAERGSKEVVVLGAAARMFRPGDIIIVLNFGFYSPEQMTGHKPTVISCDEKNNFKKMPL